MIKKLFIVMLALTFILAVAAVALAGTGRWLNDSRNYVSFAYQQQTSAWGGSGSKHDGTYSTATNKCSFCHAVHNAGYGATYAFKLLRADTSQDVGGACVFCHQSGASTIPQPYDTTGIGTERARHRVPTQATIVPDSNLATSATIGTALDCKDCHNAAPHRAADGQNVYKLLRSAAVASSGYIRPICIRCHNLNDVESWDLGSHVLTVSNSSGDLRNVGYQRVYDNASTRDCKACHANTGGVGIFPHVSAASRFLTTVAGDLSQSGTTGTLDAVCVQCHRFGLDGSSGSTASGVGISF